MAGKAKKKESEDSPASGLATILDPTTTSFDDAWVGMEPTFQSAKSVNKWREMSADEK